MASEPIEIAYDDIRVGDLVRSFKTYSSPESTVEITLRVTNCDEYGIWDTKSGLMIARSVGPEHSRVIYLLDRPVVEPTRPGAVVWAESEYGGRHYLRLGNGYWVSAVPDTDSRWTTYYTRKWSALVNPRIVFEGESTD